MKTKPYRKGDRLIEFVRDVMDRSFIVLEVCLGVHGCSPRSRGRSSEKSSGIDFNRDNFKLCERPIRSRVTLRKEGQVALGRRLNNLARRDVAAALRQCQHKFLTERVTANPRGQQRRLPQQDCRGD